MCSDCGAEAAPWEVDLARQQRQAWSSEVVALLDPAAPSTHHEHLQPLNIWSDLSHWLEGFLGDIAAAVADHTTSHRVQDRVRRLVRWRTALLATPRYRPWLTVWSSVEAIISTFEEVARQFLLAISAERPIDAQHCAAAGQAAIDRAAGVARDLGPKLDRWSRIADAEDIEESFTTGVLAALQESGATGPLELDAVGAARFHAITGSSSPAPTGIGIGLCLTEVQVEFMLDADAFWAASARTFQTLAKHETRMQSVLTDSTVSADVSVALTRGYDAAVALHALASVSRRDRHELQALMAFGHTLLEGPGRRLLAIAAAIVSQRPIARLRTDDLSTLCQIANQGGLGEIVDRVELAIRLAKAHESYTIEGDGDALNLVLNPGRGEVRLTLDAFVDRVLAGLEAVLLLHTVIVCAQASLGLDVRHADPLEALDLEIETVLAMTLGMSGWTDVRFEREGEKLTIRGAAPRVNSKSFAIVGMLMPYLPGDLTSLTLAPSVGGMEHVLAGELAVLRQHLRSGDKGIQDVLFVEACASWQLDGAPLLSCEHVRKWCAVCAVQSLTEPLPTRVASLKRLHVLATRLGDRLLAESVQACISQARNRELGLPGDPRSQTAVERLADWLNLEVPSEFPEVDEQAR